MNKKLVNTGREDFSTCLFLFNSKHVSGRIFETPNYKFLWLIKYFIRAALDAAKGMEYLHANGVVHENLKTENLLYGKVREVRSLLVDSKKSDIFSYGSVL